MCGAVRLSAQVNLVPNPSFESYINCPSATDQLYLASPWYKIGTSDFFHQCATGWTAGVPLNVFGNQNPRTGNGYAGFAAEAGFDREYLAVMLSQPLTAGQIYCVEFYVSLSDSSRWAIDEIGLFFSDSAFSWYATSSSVYELPVNPQITSPPDSFIISKTEWTRIHSEYLAIGNEQYIVIGNFKSYANTDTVNLNNGSENGAYYYIDDIYVALCDSTIGPQIAQITVPNVFTPNSDAINDLWTIDATGLRTWSCKIYNRWGGEVFSFQEQGAGWNGKDQNGNDCPDGVYYYIITGKSNDEKEYQTKGFVQLLR
jgi:gliding motility-associated-like protein